MRLLIVAVLASTAVIVTSAVALSGSNSARNESGADPLQGIAAASSAPAGVADSVALAQLTSLKSNDSGPIQGQELDKARLLPSSISGRHLYLIPSSSGDLCMFLQSTTEACTSPLTAAHPATFSVVDADGPGGSGPLVFGVAENGVSTISFTVAGQTQTVPVRANVFSYQAGSSINADDISGATATLASGQSVSLG